MLLYLAVLLVTALVFHGELAGPGRGRWAIDGVLSLLSVGGVLGGIFNSLIAPVGFHTVMECRWC